MSFRSRSVILTLSLFVSVASTVDAADLWAYRPVSRPALPTVEDGLWVHNAIDRFVLARLEANGLAPAAAASRRQRVRRAFLDIVGLPPSPGEVNAFLDDSAPDAWERLIDRLLANPHHGERWGRHWLDLVRYADTNGYEVDGIKPFAWRYRDYVITALNKDTPYDRFVLEQLAGDELPDANSETVIATGYYRLGPWDAERSASVQKSEVIEERANELDDMVSTTSQVFLGLTLGCARCHDHKFDPLTSDDYYRMVAIVSPLRRHRNGRTELSLPAAKPSRRQALQQADHRIGELEQRVRKLRRPLRDGWLASGNSKLPTDAVAAFRTPPEKRDDAQKKLVEKHAGALAGEVANAAQSKEFVQRHLLADTREQIAGVEREIDELRSRHRYPEAYYLHEPSPNPPVTHTLIRGNPGRPGREIGPGIPASLVSEPPEFLSPDAYTSRRRLTLARWVASVENPLTARVIVNRVWQHHFGLGLVRTPSDFGKRGDVPTHPLLLDFLADWFVRDARWSIKKLHRLIMASTTYRMSKVGSADGAARDAGNRLLWRFPRRRLEMEVMRDSMLKVSGALNNRLFGPSMYPRVSEDAKRSNYDPKKAWKPFDEKDGSRRTIYAFLKRTMILPMFDVLDFCDTTRSSARRNVSTVAPQALTLFNGEFVNRQARHFADRLLREAGTDAGRQLDLAYQLALGRSPTSGELADFVGFLDAETRNQVTDSRIPQNNARRSALVHACRVIFNLNEFFYAD